MRLDLVSFWLLSESSHRVAAEDRLESFLDYRVASQAMDAAKWVKMLEEEAETTPPEQKNDMGRFLTDLGKGFKKRG